FPMLGVFQSQPEVSNHRIPMDFSPYLLSSSPPTSSGFELMGYSTHCSNGHIGFSPSSFHTGDCPDLHFQDTKSPDRNANLNKRRNGPLKSIIIKSETSSESEGDCSCPESPHSPGRIAKKVSFADHKGLALAQVRLVKEGSDEPPHLNPEILSSLTEGANADITCKPPIKLCFSQPASDYLAFRDKVSKNLVALENVILKDYTVEGTIKVKNITFEKQVFVRISWDEWKTFEDISATYIPGPGSSYTDSFDTFSFKIDIPPNFDVSKKIQFAVCFKENGIEHWDSNGGKNYCIVSENYGYNEPSSKVSTKSSDWISDTFVEGWKDFSESQEEESSTPYY
ncbi:unnamed protein product, partial [Candidula unifasciata]